ncbi:MAG: EAL domain-containing protein [Nitrospirae bacterium]|nr:EAL domain-containing protein [Nitrospirota bacterium]
MTSKKVLVVEDESVVAMHIEDSLKKLGYAVPAVVASGEEAVKKAEEFQPDLILMDIVLKGEMDGIKASEIIHSRFNIPVIYLTAYADDAILQRAKLTEPLGYILKPFNERELRTAIEIALYKHEMETRLKKMERWLSITLKSIGDGVIATDKDMRVTFMNKVAEEITGWKHEDAMGKELAEIFNIKNGNSEDSHAVESLLLEKVLKEGIILNLMEDRVLITRDRKEVPISDSIAPIREDENNISGIVVAFRDITERKKLESTIKYQEYHDILTGLPNKALLIEHLTSELAAAHDNKKVALMFFDIDRFKTINETLGHSIGDMLLKEVGVRVRECVRGTDTIARIGGDEFGILLPDINDARDVAVIAGKIVAAFKKPYMINGRELNVSISLGISIYPDDCKYYEDLMKNADIAMYHAKERGRNNYQFYDPSVNIRTLERITLENRMRQAIELGELVVHYQPLVDIAMNRIIGAEALVRWQHPELGLLLPLQFLPIAEETGFIKLIDIWVLSTVCAQSKEWERSGLPPICISVNFSAMQFQHTDFAEIISHALGESSLDPGNICVEITENVAMRDIELTIPNLSRLKGLGINFFIDDFGTGYSSLSCLKRFPIHKLKIDKSFVHDIALDTDSKAIISAIIAMAHSLKLKVIAEGVETPDQVEFLRSIGCDEMQGYLFSKALPADGFKQLLIKQQKEG